MERVTLVTFLTSLHSSDGHHNLYSLQLLYEANFQPVGTGVLGSTERKYNVTACDLVTLV
jgi:hypothetical protein